MGANVSNYASELNDSVTENMSSSEDANATADCVQKNRIECQGTGPNFLVSNTCSATSTASSKQVINTVNKILDKVLQDQKNKGLTLFQANVANTDIKIDAGTMVNVHHYCTSSDNANAYQANTITAKYCNFPVKNVGNATARCYYSLAMSTLMNEEAQASQVQSNTGINLMTVFMIVAAVIVLIVVVIIARSLLKRGAKGNARNYAASSSSRRRRY